MFRSDAGLAMRIGRTVLLPFGPLVLAIVLGTSGVVSERGLKLLLLLAMAWFFCSLILVPALLFKGESPPASSGGDDGDDGGRPRRPSPSDRDPGGIPLPDAEQSRRRLRDHVRPKRSWLRRRSTREPGRDPVRFRAP